MRLQNIRFPEPDICRENAAFLNSKKEEQKETTAAGPVQIRVLLTDCGKLGYAQKQVSLRGNASLSMNDGAVGVLRVLT